jgi:OmcA/MtrC family decaheme c-type cytochrome
MHARTSSLHCSLLKLLACIAIGSCGDEDNAANQCTVSKTDAGEGAVITCADGSRTVLELPKSSDVACKVSTDGAGIKRITCADGSTIELSDGKDGDKGDQGAMGEPGAPGSQGMSGEDGDLGSSGRSALLASAGLALEITEVTIPDDRRPVAKLTIKDKGGHPLDRTGASTPGAVSVNFVLAQLSSSDGAVGEYVPYNTANVSGVMIDNTAPALGSATQARAESNGEWTELDISAGSYSYRFTQVLPENFEKSKTHTLAIYASRTYEGVAYAANPIKHFRPDGMEVTETREVVSTAACNKCHNTLRVHGGSRRELGLCITCHVKDTKDPETGNSLGLSEMIHKVHSGKSLPSVVAGTPYKIIGYNGAVHDYSEITFPQALQNCATCHQGANADHWKTSLNRAACNGCHDRISYMSPAPAGYTLHTGGQQTTDTLCGNCHAEGMGPIATLETDIVKIHRRRDELPLRDGQGQVVSEAPVLTGNVVSVTNTGPSDSPMVRFTVAVNDQPYDILAQGNALNRLRFTFAGPTTDYTGYVTYTAQGMGAVGTLAAGGTAGEFTWTVAGGVTMTTIATACGTEPEGSFAVGMEGRMTANASLPSNMQVSVNYPMHNRVAYFAVTDPEPVPRRIAVTVENCNNCHEDLAAHGGSRNDPEYCVLCHNANTNSTNVPAPPVGMTKLTSSVRMSHMVHRIHIGKNGSSPYIVAGHDFSEVLFPGEPKQCTNCHVPSHYELPLPNLLPSKLTQIDSDRARVPNTDHFIPATGAACSGCHDSADTLAHVEAMTTSTGKESCAVCHGAGTTHDVDLVHATPGL